MRKSYQLSQMQPQQSIFCSDQEEDNPHPSVKIQSSIEKVLRRAEKNFKNYHDVDIYQELTDYSYQLDKKNKKRTFKKVNLFHNTQKKKQQSSIKTYQTDRQLRESRYPNTRRKRNSINYAQQNSDKDYLPSRYVQYKIKKFKPKSKGPYSNMIRNKFNSVKEEQIQADRKKKQIEKLILDAAQNIFHISNVKIQENLYSTSVQETKSQKQLPLSKEEQKYTNCKIQQEQQERTDQNECILEYNAFQRNVLQESIVCQLLPLLDDKQIVQSVKTEQEQSTVKTEQEQPKSQKGSQKNEKLQELAPLQAKTTQITKDNIQSLFEHSSLCLQKVQYTSSQNQDPFFKYIFDKMKQDLLYKKQNQKSSHHLSKGKMFMIKRAMEAYSKIPFKNKNSMIYIRERQTKSEVELFKKAGLQPPQPRLTNLFLKQLFQNKNFCQFFRQFVKQSDKMYRVLMNRSKQEIQDFSMFYKNIDPKNVESFEWKKTVFESKPNAPLSHLQIQMFMDEALAICDRYC